MAETREIPQPDWTHLYPSYFNPTPEEWAFLRRTIAGNDEEIKKRVFDVQAEYGQYHFTETRTHLFDHAFAQGIVSE